MEVRFHASVYEFRATAEPFYGRDPVANTIELTLLTAENFPADSLLLTICADGKPVGAALHTPPYPLACNGIPDNAIETVVEALTIRRPHLTGVRGGRQRATAFAEAWRTRTGRATRITTEERLYRMGTLRAPRAVTGSSRLATDLDRPRLVEWVGLFFAEAFGEVSEFGGEEFVDSAFRVGHQFVIWAADGQPVSIAMLRVPAGGASRIGPVFTPRQHRGQGYGSAVTAAAVELAQRRGDDDVVLFADLANPVSNSIYQKIGFEAVDESVRVEFVAVN
jgi:predicted GNAT family acetyltransferase